VFDQNGFGEHRTTYSVLPYEHVDPLSGNLLLIVTDLALPGNAGLNLTVQRVYNSAVYPDYESGSLDLEEDSWAGIGWRLHFGRVLHEDDMSGGGTAIEMGDGSRHALYHTSARPEGWITKDFWVYDKNTHTLKLPNGIVYTFGRVVFLNPRLGTVRYVTEIRDPYNNTITFSYFAAPGPPDGVAQIRQVLAADQIREVNFTYDPTLKSLASMTYDGRTWTYGQQAFGPPGYSALTSVQPPAGKPWTYTYESAPGYVGLASMLVPGGGVVSYTYGDATRYAASLTKRTRVVTARAISGHQISAGTWNFTYNDGANKDTTVVRCDCGVMRYRYQGIGLTGSFEGWRSGALAERTLESGNGTLMEREQLTWQASEAISPDPVSGEGGIWSDPAVYNALLQQRTITRGNQSWTTQYEYHTGLGNVNDHGRAWRIVESGELSRITTRTFQDNFAPYIVDRTASEDVKVGAEIVSSSWTYDLATGFLRQQRPLGVLTTFEPLSNGNVDTITDANNNRTIVRYQWGVVSEVRTPLLTTTRTIAPSGLMLGQTVGSLTTTYDYDLAFRPTWVRPPGTNPIHYEYDGTYQEWVRVARDQSQVSQQLDGFGRVISTTNRLNIKTRLERDACGRVTFQSAPYTTGTGTRGVTTQYDALNRVVKQTMADGSMTYTYGPSIVTVQDAEGRKSRYSYSAFGHPDDKRLMTTTLAYQDALAQNTHYTYDVLGNLLSVGGAMPGRTWTYDSRGLPLTDRQPETGLTTYEHDAAGRLTKTTDAKGQVTTFTYDANNRLTKRDIAGSEGDVTFTYDDHGRLKTTSHDWLVTTYTYDAATGRLLSRSDTIPTLNRTWTSSYGYDANDNLTSLVYPGFPANRRTVDYSYDIENRLTAVNQNGTPFANLFTYDDSGRLASYKTGAVTHTVAYDTRDRIQRVTAGPSGTPALDLTYSYNKVSEVTRIEDGRGASMLQTFGYDTLDRLLTANGPYGAMSWTYDAPGNRLTETRGGTTAYVYDQATQRLASTSGTSAETFGYDQIGQLTSDGRATYTYLGNGLLKTGTGPSFSLRNSYNGDDLRMLRELNGVRTWSVRGAGGHVLSEYDESCGSAPIWTRDLIYAGDTLLGAVRGTIPLPTVTFETGASTVGETASSVAPRVKLTTPTGTPLTCQVSVSFDTRPGTATPNGDYTPKSGRVDFLPGTASGTTIAIAPSIPLLTDDLDEPDETFSVALTVGTNATLGAFPSHVVTLQDDDLPPALTINSFQVNEASGTATFTVSLSALSGNTVSVNYATADQTALACTSTTPPQICDYGATSGTLVLSPSTPAGTITVTLLNNQRAEVPETFAVNLSSPVNATLANSQGIATINDDEVRAPIDPALPALFVPDVHSSAAEAGYLQLYNPHTVPLTARLTFTWENGSGTVRDVAVPAGRRVDIDLAAQDGIGGTGDFSLAIQSLDATRQIVADHSGYASAATFAAGRNESATTGPGPTWYFAEGTVSSYFDEYLTIHNVTNGAVDVTVTVLPTSGSPIVRTYRIVEGPGRLKLRLIDQVGPITDHATIVTATAVAGGAPASIVVERTSWWPASSPQESASAQGKGITSNNWYFAEGGKGFWSTYVSLLNPSTTQASTVVVAYLHDNGQTYTQPPVTVGAMSRTVVSPPASMPDGGFAVHITTSNGVPVVADRAMYGGTNWILGSSTRGASALYTRWLFAEGVSNSFFDTYFLIANPNTTTATVRLTYRRTDGTSISPPAITIPPRTRVIVYADGISGVNGSNYATEVSSTNGVPVVAERAMYWPDGNWTGSHVSIGRPQ
jgi:YD repeat-containing protein